MTFDRIPDEILRRAPAVFTTRHGDNIEHHCDCPYCGKPAARGQTHFSYSEYGCHCFVCGNGGSLNELLGLLAPHLSDAERQRLRGHPALAAPKPKPKPAPPKWQSITLAKWLGQYGSARAMAAAQRAWRAYRDILDPAVIRQHYLAVGRVPGQSICRHDRLLLPIFNELEQLVCIRGRAIDCDCSRKWLTPSGWTVDQLPLYGAAALTSQQIVLLTESPSDVLAWQSAKIESAVCLATYAATYFNPAWVDVLRNAQGIICAYDNDKAGAENNLKLRRKLLAAGLRPVTIFEWGDDKPRGYDLSNMIEDREYKESA